MEFIKQAKACPVPFANILCIMDEGKTCVVPCVRASSHDTKTLPAMRQSKKLKQHERHEIHHLATMVEVKSVGAKRSEDVPKGKVKMSKGFQQVAQMGLHREVPFVRGKAEAYARADKVKQGKPASLLSSHPRRTRGTKERELKRKVQDARASSGKEVERTIVGAKRETDLGHFKDRIVEFRAKVTRASLEQVGENVTARLAACTKPGQDLDAGPEQGLNVACTLAARTYSPQAVNGSAEH